MEFIFMALALVAFGGMCIGAAVGTLVLAVRYWWVLLLGLIGLSMAFGGGS
jgi:hypothetical protein